MNPLQALAFLDAAVSELPRNRNWHLTAQEALSTLVGVVTFREASTDTKHDSAPGPTPITHDRV